MSRLIDADHLKAAFLNSSHVWMSYEQAAQAVDREPTADARPVIHAHWKITDRDGYDIECSHCGGEAPYGMDGADVIGLKYCSDCGAYMDEEPENAFD